MGLSLESSVSTLEGAAGPAVGMLGAVFGVGVAAVALEVPQLAKKAFTAVFGDAFEPVQQAAPTAPAFKAPANKM